MEYNESGYTETTNLTPYELEQMEFVRQECLKIDNKRKELTGVLKRLLESKQ
jgi:hypothetical protein